MERKNTGQLSLACTGNLRDNRQPRRLGSVLPSSNAIILILGRNKQKDIVPIEKVRNLDDSYGRSFHILN